MPAEQPSRIAVNPEVHFGKPCVAGTRIPVRDVLELVQEGLSFETITSDYYPDLEEADVKACWGIDKRQKERRGDNETDLDLG